MAISDLSTVQITVRGQSNGQSVVNVLHYIPSMLAPAFSSTPDQILNAFRSAWRAAVLPHISQHYAAVEYALVEIRGTEADPNNPNAFRLRLGEAGVIAGVAVSDQGVLTTDPLPTYCAATFQKRTLEAGRSKRGSLRLGGIVEAQTEATQPNTLTAAARNALANVSTFLTQVLSTGVAGDTLNPCVFSRELLLRGVNPKNDTLGARFAITKVILNAFVGSQVSRKQRATMGA